MAFDQVAAVHPQPVPQLRAYPGTRAVTGPPVTPAPAGHAASTAVLGNGTPQVVLDLEAVRRLREAAAERILEANQNTPLSSDASREQRGRAIITEQVALWANATAHEPGGRSTSPTEDRAYVDAVWNWLFRAGPLEPLLADPDIENIFINGAEVWIDYHDRPRQRIAPLTTSEDELLELIRTLARLHGGGERTLAPGSPTLALRLADGSRLQAALGVTPGVYVTIRRHRVRDVTLADMVDLGTLEPGLATFLGTLVAARRNVIVCGTQGVGKTSLLRALAREIPADERIATLETEYELFLHELPHHTQVVPFEAREGNGEHSPDGRAAGEVTIGDLIPSALRMSLSRMIVGEVRSTEIVPMLEAMTNGEGGNLCTIHVRKPHMLWDRIAQLCQTHSGLPPAFAYQLAANAIDYVVFMQMRDDTLTGGGRHRYVSHVLEMTGLGDNGRPTTNDVYRPAGNDPRAVPHILPTDYHDLVRAGLPPDLFHRAPGWRPWAHHH